MVQGLREFSLIEKPDAGIIVLVPGFRVFVRKCAFVIVRKFNNSLVFRVFGQILVVSTGSERESAN